MEKICFRTCLKTSSACNFMGRRSPKAAGNMDWHEGVGTLAGPQAITTGEMPVDASISFYIIPSPSTLCFSFTFGSSFWTAVGEMFQLLPLVISVPAKAKLLYYRNFTMTFWKGKAFFLNILESLHGRHTHFYIIFGRERPHKSAIIKKIHSLTKSLNLFVLHGTDLH